MIHKVIQKVKKNGKKKDLERIVEVIEVKIDHMLKELPCKTPEELPGYKAKIKQYATEYYHITGKYYRRVYK